MDKRRHPRFIKRLTTKFIINNESFTGISSDLSESGLFIRTNRGCSANTPIDIKIFMPDNSVSSLKGIVRRTIRTPISSMKNGMGIEIIEKDGIFINFVKSIIGEKGKNTGENLVTPESPNISCSNHETKKKDFGKSVPERRQHKRFIVENVTINGEISSVSEVKIINISLDGLLAKADKRLDIGNKYALKISYKDKELFVKAAVIWSSLTDLRKDSPDNIIPIYTAGMQFKDISGENIKELIYFIEEQMKVDKVDYDSKDISTQHNEFIDLYEQCKELFEGFAY